MQMVICEYVQLNAWSFMWLWTKKEKRYVHNTDACQTYCLHAVQIFLRFIKLPNIPWWMNYLQSFDWMTYTLQLCLIPLDLDCTATPHLQIVYRGHKVMRHKLNIKFKKKKKTNIYIYIYIYIIYTYVHTIKVSCFNDICEKNVCVIVLL